MTYYPEVTETPGVPEPGSTCPTCKRRVSHPRKESSPSTKVASYRIPLDEYKAHEDIVEATARFIGCFERPHWRYQLFTYALAYVLQDEAMRGIAQRNHE